LKSIETEEQRRIRIKDQILLARYNRRMEILRVRPPGGTLRIQYIRDRSTYQIISHVVPLNHHNWEKTHSEEG